MGIVKFAVDFVNCRININKCSSSIKRLGAVMRAFEKGNIRFMGEREDRLEKGARSRIVVVVWKLRNKESNLGNHRATLD